MAHVFGRNVFITTLLLCCHATAQAPAPDFSAGFAKLAALGMPALDSQAKWSSLPDSGSSNYELREFTKSLKGNTWLIPSTDGKIRTIPMGGTGITEIDPSDKSEPARKRKAPAPQDLAKDTAALISALRKAAAKKNPDDDYSYRSSGSNCGSFLLFATQLHQTGHAESANQLALAVFENFPSREAAVDAAINEIASNLYQNAAREFFRSGDWAAYHQALASLTNRFPRGWPGRDAVAMFLPQLEKQAAGTKAPPPSLPDVPIDQRALDIIRELTEKPPAVANQTGSAPTDNIPPELRYRMQMMGSIAEYQNGDHYTPSALWIIHDPSGETENKSPVARLAGLKLAALPALAALATDPFLTHIPNPQSYSGYYSSSDESSEERAIRAYNALQRPSTRGEIARRLLAATLPDPQSELDDADPETIRDLALAFWKEHKNSTREQIAAVFLREGSRSQSSQAASILATSSDPEAHRIFESHVLASEQAIASFQEVQIYLKSRKAAAKPFFESYAKLVRSQTPASTNEENGYDENSWEIKQAGGVNKILKQLETLVGAQSPRALAVQIAKGKPEDAENFIKSLTTLLADASPTKHLFTLLEGANAAAHEETRARFLKATFSIRWPGNDQPEEENSTSPERKVSEPEAKVWKKLLTDTRAIPGNLNRFQLGKKSSVAELAACAFEYSVSHSNYYAAFQAAPILAKPPGTVIQQQAAARLSGKPIPQLPDASRVAKERLTEIIAEAGKKPSAEIHPYLLTLTPDERAAWAAWSNEPGDIPCPASIIELRSIIISRSPGSSSRPDVKGAANMDVGFKITAENLTKQIEALAADIEKHSRTLIWIRPADFPSGLQIMATIAPLPSPKPTESTAGDFNDEESIQLSHYFSEAIRILESDATPSAIAIVNLSGNEARHEFIWSIQNGKASLRQEEDQKEPTLESTLKPILESKNPQMLQLQFQILSRADAEKFSTSND